MIKTQLKIIFFNPPLSPILGEGFITFDDLGAGFNV